MKKDSLSESSCNSYDDRKSLFYYAVIKNLSRFSNFRVAETVKSYVTPITANGTTGFDDVGSVGMSDV